MKRPKKSTNLLLIVCMFAILVAASSPPITGMAQTDPPQPTIEVFEKSPDPVPAAVEMQAAPEDENKQPGWLVFSDAYWQFDLLYPPDWVLQPDPHLGFGMRISSPDASLDELGEPLTGAFFAVFAAAMPDADWQGYYQNLLAETAPENRQEISLAGLPALQISSTDGFNRPALDVFCHQQGFFYRFHFIQADRSITLRGMGAQMLASIRFNDSPQAHPLPDYARMGIDLMAFSFPALKIPFQNGWGKIASGGGYNNGDMHRNYDLNAFDFCENGTCIGTDRWAIAPTDITYLHTASNVPDYHFFEIANDGSNRLCMSLAHFNFGNFGVPIVAGMRFPRGAVLGALSNFSPPHLHMGIWTAPSSSTCWTATNRVAIPYTGSYALDGVSYTYSGAVNEHAGKTVTSTNYPMCAMPVTTRAAEFKTWGIRSGPGDCFSTPNPGTLLPPILNQPTQGQVLSNRMVVFVWQSSNSTNQTGYTFRLSEYANPDTQPWVVDTGLGNEWTNYSHTFSKDGTFYWHMRTWNTSGNHSAWVTRSFSINTSSGSSEVVLCGSDNGSSDCWAFPLGVYTNLSTWGLNDRMRSAFVPSGKSVFLFREGDLRGTGECYSGNRAPLPSGDPWDLRGQVTAVQTFNQSGCPSASLYSVVVYDGVNHSGHQWGLGFNEGIHNFNQLGGPADQYFNDKGESIRIPTGWSVRLFEHNGGAGSPSGCLTGNVNEIGALKNVASSAELFRNTTCTPPIPAQPSNVSVTSASQTSLSLSWQDNSSNESGFKIYRWGWNGSVWDFHHLATVAANATAFTDTGLYCSKEYFYEISAYNGGGESAHTNWVKGTTSACPVVEVTGSWSGDAAGYAKTVFIEGEPLRWVLDVHNATGVAVTIQLRYVISNPAGSIVFDATYPVDLPSGTNYGVSLLTTTPADTGSYYFQGFGTYLTHNSYAETTYWVWHGFYIPLLIRK